MSDAAKAPIDQALELPDVGVKLLNLTQLDFEEAVSHYGSKQAGLGDRFRNEVLRSISRIGQFLVAHQHERLRERNDAICRRFTATLETLNDD